MPDRVTALEENFSSWIRTATAREIIVVLDAIGRELLLRPPAAANQAGVSALRAANLLRPLADNAVVVTVTNLTDRPNRIEIRA